MSDKFQNLQTDGEVDTVNPDAKQDYFGVDDYMRDHDYMQFKLAQVLKSISSRPNENVQILYGGHVHDGGSGTVDIEEGMAIAFDLDGEVRIVKIPEQTGVSLPSGWNDDRQIWVVSKYDFKLTALTRNHYLGQSYHYEVQDTHHADANAYGNGSGPPTNDSFLDASPASTYVVWGSFKMNGTTYTEMSVGERSHEYSVAGALSPGMVTNLGLVYSSNIMKLAQADGTNLSKDGFGTAAIQSVTDGRLKLFRVYKNTHLIEDAGGSSDWIGEEFGTTAATAFSEDRPLYPYLVNSDDTDEGVELAWSPNPAAKVSPATTNCGYHGSPAATPSDSNFFFATTTDVTTSHAQKPCTRIGGARVQKDGSDDWTFQALDQDKGDGIRQDPFVDHDFTFPTGQMGAEASQYYSNSGGNGPTWATPANIVYKYRVGLDGRIHIHFNTRAAGNVTNGTSGSQIRMHAPYTVLSGVEIVRFAIGDYIATGAPTTGAGLLMGRFEQSAGNYILFYDYAGQSILYNDFSNANDDVSMYFSYYAF